MWLSLVERLLWEQDAAGSNPVIRTKNLLGRSSGRFLLFHSSFFTKSVRGDFGQDYFSKVVSNSE